jgi:hypothetical protein
MIFLLAFPIFALPNGAPGCIINPAAIQTGMGRFSVLISALPTLLSTTQSRYAKTDKVLR